MAREAKGPIRSHLALRILGAATERLGREGKDFALALSGRRAQVRADHEEARLGKRHKSLKSQD